MARYGITFEEVAKVAHALLQQRQNPTIEAVRAALGGTGSFATISKHLHTWRAEQLLATTKEAPEKIISTNEVNHAVNSIWEQLNHQAQQQVDKIRQESEEKINQLLQAHQQLELMKRELEEALNQKNTQINHLQADVTLLKKELNEEQRQRVIGEEGAKRAESTLTKIEMETTQHRVELKSLYENAVKTMKIQYGSDLDRMKTLVENQRTDFMLKLDSLYVAKEKLERAQAKSEAELSQQIMHSKQLEERARRAEFDLQVTQQHKGEQEREVITLREEVKQKDYFLNQLKEQVGLGQQKGDVAIEQLKIQRGKNKQSKQTLNN